MYHFFRTSTLRAHDPAVVAQQYAEGYVFTRRGNTVMHQVRSVRVPLAHFTLSSENRRVVRKHPALSLRHYARAQFAYHWTIGKMAKEFYDQFGAKTFSANKVRELLCGHDSPINAVFEYREEGGNPCGYCLIVETQLFIHYAYPFHELPYAASLGMAMMVQAVQWARDHGKQHIYLGSIQNEKSLYKFQFKGVEWFDGEKWRKGKPLLSELKVRLSSPT